MSKASQNIADSSELDVTIYNPGGPHSGAYPGFLLSTSHQLSPRNIKKTFDAKRSLFEALAIVYTFVLVLIGKVFYNKLLSVAPGSISFFGSLTTFIFGASIIWSFVKQRWTETAQWQYPYN